jgi:hypothetical protein
MVRVLRRAVAVRDRGSDAMSLSCSCDGDYDWWYIPDADYSTLTTKRSRKCWSCGERIQVGALVLRCDCFRYAESEVEIRIYGEGNEVELAPRYLCERCADLYLSLAELGYCINMGDDVRELVKEYAEMQREDAARRKAGAMA